MTLQASSATRRLHRRLLGQLDELEIIARDASQLVLQADSVSVWSVGEQVEHVVRADRLILGRLQEIRSGPTGRTEESGGPTLLGRIVLTLGFIPRGKGKAPGGILPTGYSKEDLDRGIEEVRRELDSLTDGLGELDRLNWTFPHQVLGHFTPRQWLRFLDVHHRHHDKIIRDIRKAAL